MLVLQLEATYLSEDGSYGKNGSFPVLAITKSDDIDLASKCVSELMTSNGWGEFSFSRYGTVKGSSDAPKSFGDPAKWLQSLNEQGAIYIVYTK